MTDTVTAMKPSKASVIKAGTRTVLAPREGLTHQNCEELEATFNKCIAEGGLEIILNCKAVPLLDSAALELLLRKHEELRDRGGTLKLISMNDVCKDILVATRLINILDVHEDIRGAIKSQP